MKLKKGDRLFCHKACKMKYGGYKTTTVGNIYTIEDVHESDDEFYILDDDQDDHFFSLRNDSYKEYFYPEKELRKYKLKIINNINL